MGVDTALGASDHVDHGGWIGSLVSVSAGHIYKIRRFIMSMNDVVSAERVHIGFFGCRNAGKSSLVNAITAQELSVVSDTAGTTTDPVKKSMELLPIGPVVIVDTPGFDDLGELGENWRVFEEFLRFFLYFLLCLIYGELWINRGEIHIT